MQQKITYTINKSGEIELTGLFGDIWKCDIVAENQAISKCKKVAFSFEYIDNKPVSTVMLDLTRIKDCNFE